MHAYALDPEKVLAAVLRDLGGVLVVSRVAFDAVAGGVISLEYDPDADLYTYRLTQADTPTGAGGHD